MVCRRRRGYGSGRLSLRFAVCHLDRGRRCGHNSHLAAPGVSSPREHATSSWANSQIEFDFQATKYFGIFPPVQFQFHKYRSHIVECKRVFVYYTNHVPLDSTFSKLEYMLNH